MAATYDAKRFSIFSETLFSVLCDIFGTASDSSKTFLSNSSFVLLILKMISIASNRSLLRMTNRLRSFGHKAKTIAILGFAKEGNSLFCCVCGIRGDANGVTVSHRSDCFFLILYEIVNGQRNLSTVLSADDRELLLGLQQMLISTRVQTVEELGHTKDTVCIQLCRRWLQKRDFYPNAGTLLDDLENEEEKREKDVDENLVLEGITDQILQLTVRPDTSIVETCPACHNAPVAYRLFPCEHQAFCEQCSSSRVVCSICFQPFTVMLHL